MATYGDLSHFTYAELQQFRYIELEILSLEQLMKMSNKQLSPDLVREASEVAEKHGLPDVATVADALKLLNALLSLALTASGKGNVLELLRLVEKFKTFFSN